MSAEEGSPGKEGKVKPLVAVEAAKLELPATPKSSHKRKLEADNIVVTMTSCSLPFAFFELQLHFACHTLVRYRLVPAFGSCAAISFALIAP